METPGLKGSKEIASRFLSLVSFMVVWLVGLVTAFHTFPVVVVTVPSVCRPNKLRLKMLQPFIQQRVASVDFHLGRDAVEGQKFKKPLSVFLRGDSSLNYIQPF